MTVPVSTPRSDHKQTHDYAYYKEIFADRPMPFAYLDLDLLDQNIHDIAAAAGGKRIRLASKSLRCIEVLRRILKADPIFQGIMSYSPREAIYLATQGFKDILLGYPIWNKQDLSLIAGATREGAQIALMIDSLEHVEQAEKVAQSYQVRLPLCLDIDMSLPLPGLHFGVWRSALRTREQVLPLVKRITASQHVWLDGVMGYEAQIAGVSDYYPGNPIKTLLVKQLKQRSLKEFVVRRKEIVELIKEHQPDLRVVNGGGTGSLKSTREESVVTEITVGSGFYSPTLFDAYRDFRYQPALGYAIEIVRHPQPSIYTCLGGGYIASGATGPEKSPKPYLPSSAKLDSIEGAGEVQTPIHLTTPTLKLGDPIFMRHSKAGELCERFTHLLLVSDGTVAGETTTYRGDGQCFI